MAAPTEVLSTGTASVLSIGHEPTSSPKVKLDSLTRKSSREHVPIVNTNRTVVRIKRVNPTLILSFEGEINAASGLGDEGPGELVTSLANFAAAYRDFDNAVGELILGDPEDKISLIDDRPLTSFDVTHYPYVEA